MNEASEHSQVLGGGEESEMGAYENHSIQSPPQ